MRRMPDNPVCVLSMLKLSCCCSSSNERASLQRAATHVPPVNACDSCACFGLKTCLPGQK